MGASTALGYLWSIGHCVLLGLVTFALMLQLQRHMDDPHNFPMSAFFVVKAGSILVSMVLLLLIRWRVSDFGHSTTDGYFRYNDDHVDPPGGFHTNAAFDVMGILLCINILEAVVTEYLVGRTRLNPLLGLSLIISFWFQPSPRTVSVTWVTAYTLWNCVFCCMRFGIPAAQVQLGHNVIPFVLCVCYGDGNAWVFWRCFALASFLAFIDNSLTTWIPNQTPEWKNRWLGPCAENEKQVLTVQQVVLMCLIGGICLIATVVHPTGVV